VLVGGVLALEAPPAPSTATNTEARALPTAAVRPGTAPRKRVGLARVSAPTRTQSHARRRQPSQLGGVCSPHLGSCQRDLQLGVELQLDTAAGKAFAGRLPAAAYVAEASDEEGWLGR